MTIFRRHCLVSLILIGTIFTASATFAEASDDADLVNRSGSGTLATRTLVVNTVLDSGEGSLRNAILTVNRESIPAGDSFRIVFEIPPGGASHQTIQPLTPLPPLEKPVAIDGTTQTVRYGDTNPDGPEIVLNGSLLTQGDGLVILSGASIDGIVINGFPGNGVLLMSGSGRASIQNSYIGTDLTGRQPVPNVLRGVVIANNARQSKGFDSHDKVIDLRDNVISGNGRSGVYVIRGVSVRLFRNRIGAAAGPTLAPLGNGASGIYFGAESGSAVVEKNIIAFNAHAGIAVDKTALDIDVRSNSFVENGSIAIDNGLDGVTLNVPKSFRRPPNYPVIASARYDPASSRTTITGHLEAPSFFGTVQFFASTSPDPSGFGEAELMLGQVLVNGTTFQFDSRLDLRGRFLTATATAISYGWDVTYYNTSEFSQAFRVEGEAAGPISRDLRPREADLSLTITGGSPIRIEFRNSGPAAAENVEVDLTIDTSLVFGELPPFCRGSGTGSVRCTVARLQPNEVRSFEARVSPPLQPSSARVLAQVSSSTEDTDLSNNQGTLFVSLSPDYLFTLRTEVISPVVMDPTSLASFAVNVINQGPGDAPDVAITIPLASGWSFHSGPTSGWSCTMEGQAVLCRKPNVAARTTETFRYTLRTPDSIFGALSVMRTTTTTASGIRGFVQDSSVTYETYSILEVTTTGDAGVGTLRTALTVIRASPLYVRYKIVFNIPFGESRDGVFTIRPLTPLPHLGRVNLPATTEVSIDGRTQTTRTGDTNGGGPEVEISGVLQSEGSGLVINAETSTIRGLGINGFPEDGIVVSSRARIVYIADNSIGTDASGRVAVPNRRRGISLESPSAAVDVIGNLISGNGRSGVYVPTGRELRLTGNRIGVSSETPRKPLPNGASGVYIAVVPGAVLNANEISHNREAGIALAREASQTTMRGNSMVSNGGLGIDYGIDGVTFNGDPNRPINLPRYPQVTSASWDASAQMTRVEGTVEEAFAGGVVELFRNGSSDASGFGECEELAGEALVPRSIGAQRFSILVPRDLRGSFVTATWTSAGATSEISAAVRVE